MRGMKTRIRDSVNSMSEESCEERLQYLIATAERPGLRGCSDHAVQVLEKRAFQIGTWAGDGMAVGLLFQAVLWTWFLGCVITYRIGKHLLVEGEGFKSIEFSMRCRTNMIEGRRVKSRRSIWKSPYRSENRQRGVWAIQRQPSARIAEKHQSISIIPLS